MAASYFPQASRNQQIPHIPEESAEAPRVAEDMQGAYVGAKER